MAKNETTLKDATNIDELKRCEIIISCQGGDYTTEVFPKLRAAGWNGYWIDAASTLRMDKDAVIVLDPVNLNVIKDAMAKGVKNFKAGLKDDEGDQKVLAADAGEPEVADVQLKRDEAAKRS